MSKVRVDTISTSDDAQQVAVGNLVPLPAKVAALEVRASDSGVLVKTPDGTKTYRIGVTNAGAITAVLVT